MGDNNTNIMNPTADTAANDVNSGSETTPPLVRRATVDNANLMRRKSSNHWNIVKQHVEVEYKTSDIWAAMKDAILEKDESDSPHRNDKNDDTTVFSFKEFRRELSFFKRSTTSSISSGDMNWAEELDDSYDNSDDDDDDDDSDDFNKSLGSKELEEDDEETVVEVQQLGTRVDRLQPSRVRAPSRRTHDSTLVQSLRRTAISSSTRRSLNCSMNGSMNKHSSLARHEMEELLQLSSDEAVKEWARSFYHTDPRWQILTFFNDVALLGTKSMEKSEGIIDELKKFQIPFLLRVFVKAGVFSVWRPTSNEAIKYMMTGEGVGKGLDIKGKSALKGKYSGFVPFMQIHKNEDKDKVGTMSSDNRVRVFYPNKSSRDKAATLLEPLRKMMLYKAESSLKVINDTEELEAKVLSYAMKRSKRSFKYTNSPSLSQMKMVAEESRRMLKTTPMQEQQGRFEQALADKSDNMMGKGGDIIMIDEYADRGVYGLELPEKLFWKGYVERNDITREEGSEDDTGRRSIPEFQVMNLETLRKQKKSKKSMRALREPRPVLYHAGCGRQGEPLEDDTNPLCPLDLLMAYEEVDGTSGKVTPVVSDFDCFLVGTRGVKFSEPLEEQERETLTSCVNDIEGILASPEEGVSWTSRWLEVKKNHIRQGEELKECKRFGYADPKSYTMMKGAVHRLRGNGAVRHGPECFNYSFPQELDDKFLVISDTLQGSVPWKYVDEAELRDILEQRIDEGFTFPMNPAWILCNPKWKRLYDKLLASDKPNVQESIAIWYPEDVQRRIHEITTKYPTGFMQERRGSGVDLAEMELQRFDVGRKGRNKLKQALARRLTGGKRSTSTLFSNTLLLLQMGKESDKKSNGTAPEEDIRGSKRLSAVKESNADLLARSNGLNASSNVEVNGDGKTLEQDPPQRKTSPEGLLRRGSNNRSGSMRSSLAKVRRKSVDQLMKPIRALSGSIRRSSSNFSSRDDLKDIEKCMECCQAA